MNSINTNEYANVLNGSINSSSKSISSILERMSSGLRINGAKDDASGMKISSRMALSLSGMKIAQNNLQNGCSLLNVAEGALNNASDLLLRLRSLSLKAVNETYSSTERNAMSDEAEELVEELERIQSSTKYSQLNIFNNQKNSKDSGSSTNSNNNSNDSTGSNNSSSATSATFSLNSAHLANSIN